MKIRDYISSDKEQVYNLAEKYGLNLPIDSRIVVAEDNNGKIVGFVSIRPIIFVEPMICENPLTAVKLWKDVEGKLKESGIGIVRCFSQKKHKKTYEKKGFKQIFEDELLMENIL